MKGAQSANDESRLSFQVVAIDPASHQLTVREGLWNITADHVVWGESSTQALALVSFTP